MLHRLRIIAEAAFYSLLIFRLLSGLLVDIFATKHFIFYTGIVLTHYITLLFLGFWNGFFIKTDGWIYSLASFGFFYLLRQIFDVYYPLPLSTSTKLWMFLPLLALLLIASIYGEIAAEKREDKLTEDDKK
ncbi:MAG: hypothetical protein QMD53_06460 [Actinomycetota bacterium]|nr:hypothetical protein [Actinomycetota bacterium]